MINIFEYTDYRQFLKDFIADARLNRGSYSIRELAQRCGMTSHAYLARVISGKQKISNKMTFRLIEGLKLSGKKIEYFENMVLYNQAENTPEKSHYFKRMNSLIPKEQKTNIRFDQYEYYSAWYHAAIYCLIPTGKFTSPEDISKCLEPRIAIQKVRESLELQQRLGLLKINDQGFYEALFPQLSSGDFKNEAAAEQNRQMMDLARTAFENKAPGQREIKGLTFSISPEGYQKVLTAMQDFNSAIYNIVNEDQAEDRVVQLNMQLFSLARKAKK